MIVVDTNVIAYPWVPGEHGRLAEDLDLPLVTTDRRLARSLPERAVSAAAFARS